jgi:hypothetical protein
MRRERYSPKYSGEASQRLFGALPKGGRMPVTATITKEQRDGLYELVRHHLYSIEDLWIAFGRSRDYATAERLALEFGEDFRLLTDIGWGADDDRENFELTMPPLDLTELLRRLHVEAEKVLVESGTEREASEDDARTDKRFQTGHDACEKVLADLDPQTGEAP